MGALMDHAVAERDCGDEMWTPRSIIESARASMGAIDLDPASCWQANKVVQADRFISLPDDGLDPCHSWSGRVWINPPFRNGGLRKFARRLVARYEDGYVSAACFLGPLVGNNWVREMSAASSGMALLKPRLRWGGTHSGSPDMIQVAVWMLGDCELGAWHHNKDVVSVLRTEWASIVDASNQRLQLL